MKDQLIQLLLANVNLQGLSEGLLDDILYVKLQEIVADSSNPYDNMVLEALYPLIREKVLEAVAELIESVQE